MCLERVPVPSSNHLEIRNPFTLCAWGIGLLTLLGRVAALLFVLLGWSIPAMAVSYTYTIIDYPGAAGTLLEGINNNGQIVGSFFPTSNTGFIGFLPVGFLDNAGNFSPLIPPDASNRVLAFGINDSGQVSGYYAARQPQPTNPDAPAVGDRFQGFVYSNGNYSSVIVPGVNPGNLDRGRETPLMAGINNSGQTVGNGPLGAYVYSSGTFTPIQVPGPPSCPSCWFTVAWGINAKGEISGYFLHADVNINGGQGFYSGFFYSHGVYTSIDVPGGPQPFNFSGTRARGLNANGQIVGDTIENFGITQHGFVYSDGQFTPIDPFGSSFTEVTGINDKGQIVGWFFDEDLNEARGFLADPTPEPTTLLLLGTTLTGLGLARWRRRGGQADAPRGATRTGKEVAS